MSANPGTNEGAGVSAIADPRDRAGVAREVAVVELVESFATIVYRRDQDLAAGSVDDPLGERLRDHIRPIIAEHIDQFHNEWIRSHKIYADESRVRHEAEKDKLKNRIKELEWDAEKDGYGVRFPERFYHPKPPRKKEGEARLPLMGTDRSYDGIMAELYGWAAPRDPKDEPPASQSIALLHGKIAEAYEYINVEGPAEVTKWGAMEVEMTEARDREEEKPPPEGTPWSEAAIMGEGPFEAWIDWDSKRNDARMEREGAELLIIKKHEHIEAYWRKIRELEAQASAEAERANPEPSPEIQTQNTAVDTGPRTPSPRRSERTIRPKNRHLTGSPSSSTDTSNDTSPSSQATPGHGDYETSASDHTISHKSGSSETTPTRPCDAGSPPSDNISVYNLASPEGTPERDINDGPAPDPPAGDEASDEPDDQAGDEAGDEAGDDDEPPPLFPAGFGFEGSRNWPWHVLIVLFCAFIAMVVFSSCAMAEGRKYSLWRAANDMSRAQYVNQWYCIEIPVPHPVYFFEWAARPWW
ncbi:hypothetical protein BJ170DRAFT_734821 [Xylariales sp. AK1849]|nr:hypothetical protein BJ170DRAFT_734821 [Xylariales sp. AK1849]